VGQITLSGVQILHLFYELRNTFTGAFFEQAGKIARIAEAQLISQLFGSGF
jgi:hypothetical protein